MPATCSRPSGKAVAIAIALIYLTLLLLVPAANVAFQAFRSGLGAFAANLGDPALVSAIRVTLLLAVLVVPLNTAFGLCAAWVIARHQFPGRTLLVSLLDLPFAVSSVVAGLAIALLYGRDGWFGPLLEAAGIPMLFALPGMALATAFETLPFVARELIPVLEETGTEQEEAARTLGASEWQTFWRVTLPNLRWALLYGIILTNARAMGVFGSVAVISGNIIGKTQTLTLFIDDTYKQYQTQAAFAAAMLLAGLALVTLALKARLEGASAE